MEVIKILFIILIAFGICVLIYMLLSVFTREVKKNMLYDKLLRDIDIKYHQLLDNLFTNDGNDDECSILLNVNPTQNDNMYDKSDEELLQEWNDLWCGNPPCELDLKAIREEERKEKEEQNRKKDA